MNRVRGLLAAVLLASLLAGCSGRDPGDPLETTGDGRIGAAAIQGAGHFAFDHPGGDIVLSMDGRGEAVVGLIDGRDEPVSTVTFNPGATTSTIIPDQPAGEFILRVGSINGTLRIDIPGDDAPRFLPLGRHVERFTLVDRAPWTEPLPPNDVPGVTNYDPLSERMQLNFSRPPDTLTLFATGNEAGLDFRLYSGPAIILEFTSGDNNGIPIGPTMNAFGSAPALRTVPAVPHLENLVSLAVEASIVADHLDGAVILEAQSYSRARPPVPQGTQVTEASPAFVYSGSLDTGQPVRFQVAEGATRISFFLPDNATAGSHAVVAVFGPHDERIATLNLTTGSVHQMPVTDSSGDYVAVALEGNALVGADANPADFELYPIRITETSAPASSPGGSPNRYSKERFPLESEGTPFLVAADLGEMDPSSSLDPGLMSSCSQDPGSLRLLAGGETIGFWADGSAAEAAEQERAVTSAEATRLLGPGLEIERDGFGNACAFFVLHVSGYVREAATEEVAPELEGPAGGQEGSPADAANSASAEGVLADVGPARRAASTGLAPVSVLNS